MTQTDTKNLVTANLGKSQSLNKDGAAQNVTQYWCIVYIHDKSASVGWGVCSKELSFVRMRRFDVQ